MTTDILVKSYAQDAEWFTYSLRSIQKFATDFRRLVLVIPETDTDRFLSLPLPAGTCIVVSAEPANGKPYLVQQIQKMYADTYTDSDALLYLDSDTILTQPVTPATYLRDGKPLWMMTPWTDIDADGQFWRPIMAKFLGADPEFEFMRRMGQLVPRWLLADMRKFCEQKHGRALEQYIMEQPAHEYSEFNCLGFYAWTYHRDRFHWIDTSKDEWPELTVLQSWSHDPLDEKKKAELEGILNNDIETRELPARTADNTVHPVTDKLGPGDGSDRSDLRATSQASPWADKPATLARIRELARELNSYCTAPRFTGQVRDLLREERVIK